MATVMVVVVVVVVANAVTPESGDATAPRLFRVSRSQGVDLIGRKADVVPGPAARFRTLWEAAALILVQPVTVQKVHVELGGFVFGEQILLLAARKRAGMGDGEVGRQAAGQ